MDLVERAAADIRVALPTIHSGTLRVFGDWFGRPHDNRHVPVGAHAEGKVLVVAFNEDELLSITMPEDWEFTSSVFRVQRAARVTWRWYYYGRPKVPANLFTIEHESDGESVVAWTDVDWYSPTFSPSPTYPAAELF